MLLPLSVHYPASLTTNQNQQHKPHLTEFSPRYTINLPLSGIESANGRAYKDELVRGLQDYQAAIFAV